MNRRELILAISASAVVTAEGLWLPSSKLISISKNHLILSERYISLVDDYTSKVLCSVLRKVGAVSIKDDVVNLTFPENIDNSGTITSMYAGKVKIIDSFDTELILVPGMTVDVTIKDLIPEVKLNLLI